MFNRIDLSFKPSHAKALLLPAPFLAAGYLVSDLQLAVSLKAALLLLLFVCSSYTILKYALLRLPSSVVGLRMEGQAMHLEFSGGKSEAVELCKGQIWSDNFILLSLKRKAAQTRFQSLEPKYLVPVSLLNCTWRDPDTKQHYRQDDAIRRLRALIANKYFETTAKEI